MNWWQMETKEAARRLETDEKQGLTSQMATERLAQKGRNELAETDGKKSITVWVVFIIFVLGPCEALLPILTASSVLGSSAVVSSTIIFSVATIATMMLAVSLGMLGINALRFNRLEAYAHEIAGGTIMACGLAIICGL